MNTENIEELANNSAKTLIAYLYKMAKIITNNSVDEKTAMLIATAKLKEAVDANSKVLKEEEIKELIKKLEGENG